MKKASLLLWLLIFSGCAIYRNVNAPTVARPSLHLFPVKDQVVAIEKIIVRDIDEGSPLAMAGMKKGDTIIAVDGKTFAVAETFWKHILERTQVTEFKIGSSPC